MSHHGLAGGLCLLLTTPAFAENKPSVSIEASVLAEHRETAPDGTTRIKMVPAQRVTPGDRVVYQLTYRNIGTAAVIGVVIANPIAPNLVYAGPASNSPEPEVSTDGRVFAPLSSLTTRDATGMVRAATFADVRVVQWQIRQPVAAGSSGQLAFQAILK